MVPKLESTQLYKWLKTKNTNLAKRMLEVRQEVSKWLPYILQLFPHYPSHGVDHSDRIVAQLSKLPFDKNKPTIEFSAGEVYCLLCAAYLHDAGMVVSPGEASNILASERWAEFVAPSGRGHEAFVDYEKLRASNVKGSQAQHEFLQNIALRQLLAEFVRRDHHERGKTTLEMHPFLKQLVDHGDSVAFETIADLGVAHGLWSSDLNDISRFPEERDVLGDKVNVRFLARLLRIGDLLDVDSGRADPLSAKAIGPLPPDAEPHWRQYSAKKHENVTSKVIEFRFECKDQETHRVLRDWFGWLEEEVQAAGLEQLHSARHKAWPPPRCVVTSQAFADGSSGGGGAASSTIIIKPAKGATYAFHDWKLELDHERVLQRLIYDVYDDPVTFVRELIQNALDATRCQMYADFAVYHPNDKAPERPTQFPADFREQYPLVLSLTEEEVKRSPDAKPEKRRVFTIEDRGVGMDEHIITRYFLQIGRSYYQSTEFRERYKFAPTSRFGVGFLSVFAVSNDITVETARRNESSTGATGIRLILREPRSYLLTEPWAPFADRSTGNKTGTKIRVVLDHTLDERSLLDIVRQWCVAVEVPVVVREFGVENVVRSEHLADGTVLAASAVDPGGRFLLRVFDLTSHGVEGQLALIAYADERGEGWCDCWPSDKGLDGLAKDSPPKSVHQFTSFHGIAVDVDPYIRNDQQWFRRADVRATSDGIMLSRAHLSRLGSMQSPRNARYHGSAAATAAQEAVEQAALSAVEEHLETTQRANGAWRANYRGRVLTAAPVPREWRDNFPGTVVGWFKGAPLYVSVNQLLELQDVALAMWAKPLFGPVPPIQQHPRDVRLDVPVFSPLDVPAFARDRIATHCQGMNICGVARAGDAWVIKLSAARHGNGFERLSTKGWIGQIGEAALDGIQAHIGGFSTEIVVLNNRSPVTGWLQALRDAVKRGDPNIDPHHVETCLRTAVEAPYSLRDTMDLWLADPKVPQQLKPPRDATGRAPHLDLTDLVGRFTEGA